MPGEARQNLQALSFLDLTAPPSPSDPAGMLSCWLEGGKVSGLTPEPTSARSCPLRPASGRVEGPNAYRARPFLDSGRRRHDANLNTPDGQDRGHDDPAGDPGKGNPLPGGVRRNSSIRIRTALGTQPCRCHMFSARRRKRSRPSTTLPGRFGCGSAGARKAQYLACSLSQFPCPGAADSL